MVIKQLLLTYFLATTSADEEQLQAQTEPASDSKDISGIIDDGFDPEGRDEQNESIDISEETINGRTSQVERILLDRGKNSFSIVVGGPENP